jgi:predicted flap endonuclease-1-like 5' DNA nuclease
MQPSAVDLSPLDDRLRLVEGRLKALGEIETPTVDFTPLQSRLDQLESLMQLLLARPSDVPAAKPAPSRHRRAGVSANLLTTAAFGKADDLERVVGIGPVLRKLLNKHGVYYFWQIADWSQADIREVDSLLDAFTGRIQRDQWVPQARRLAKEPTVAQRPEGFGDASNHDDPATHA